MLAGATPLLDVESSERRGQLPMGGRCPAKEARREEVCFQGEIAALGHGRHRFRGATACALAEVVRAREGGRAWRQMWRGGLVVLVLAASRGGPGPPHPGVPAPKRP